MDRKMKLVYAGLMVLLMLGASVGTVVAESNIGAYLLYKKQYVEGGLAVGGGLGIIGSAIYSYATAETLSTLALAGLGVAGVGGLVVLG